MKMQVKVHVFNSKNKNVLYCSLPVLTCHDWICFPYFFPLCASDNSVNNTLPVLR